MDYLRRKHDDEDFHGDDVEPEFDPGLVHRLTAYTRGAWARNRSEEPIETAAAEIPRFTLSSEESVDADDEGHAALPAATAEAEAYEPEAGSIVWGPYGQDPEEPVLLEAEEPLVMGELEADVEEPGDPFGEDWDRAVAEAQEADVAAAEEEEAAAPAWNVAFEDDVLPEPDLVEHEAEDPGAETSREEARFGAVPEFTYSPGQDWVNSPPESQGVEEEIPVPGLWNESAPDDEPAVLEVHEPELPEPVSYVVEAASVELDAALGPEPATELEPSLQDDEDAGTDAGYADPPAAEPDGDAVELVAEATVPEWSGAEIPEPAWELQDDEDAVTEVGYSAEPATEPDGDPAELVVPEWSDADIPEPAWELEPSPQGDEDAGTGAGHADPPATEPDGDPVELVAEATVPDWGEAESVEPDLAEPDLIAEAEIPGPEDDSEPALPETTPAELSANEDVPLDEPVAPQAGELRRRSFRRARSTSPAKARERSSKHRGAKRLVGLKIGASQVAAAQVVNNGAPELVEVVREPLEAGVVVSGEIRDPEALGAALKRLFELHKLPKRGVRLGLSNNRIGVRVFEIEGVDDEQQLDNAIRFRAEEVLPIPLDEAVLDYVVLEEEVREDGTPWKRILLVVAYREVVDRYLQACRSAGLEVIGIDLEAFALLRSVEAPMDRGVHAGALVAVAIGHDRSTIAVSTGRFCEFTRVLDWGGWSLNVAIARELDKAPSEVEGFKRQLSFSSATDVDGLTPEQAAKAREAIQRSLAAFVRELVASLQFYQAQPGALGIGEVVLTGGTAHMDGLPEALGELVGVPIRLGDPFKRVKVGPKVSHEGPRGSLSVAIGLGIED